MNEHDYALRDAAMAEFVDSYFKARPQLMRTRHEECLVEAGFKAAWKPDQTERAEKAEAELAKLRQQEPVAYRIDWPLGLQELGWQPDSYDEDYVPSRGLPNVVPLYAAPVPAVAAPAVPRKYHEFASVMLDAQPFITAETYGGRYIVAMRFERLGKMQDCHAALLALLQSAHTGEPK